MKWPANEMPNKCNSHTMKWQINKSMKKWLVDEVIFGWHDWFMKGIFSGMDRG